MWLWNEMKCEWAYNQGECTVHQLQNKAPIAEQGTESVKSIQHCSNSVQTFRIKHTFDLAGNRWFSSALLLVHPAAWAEYLPLRVELPLIRTYLVWCICNCQDKTRQGLKSNCWVGTAKCGNEMWLFVNPVCTHTEANWPSTLLMYASYLKVMALRWSV